MKRHTVTITRDCGADYLPQSVSFECDTREARENRLAMETAARQFAHAAQRVIDCPRTPQGERVNLVRIVGNVRKVGKLPPVRESR